MTISLKHTFVSFRGDGADASLVQPSNWNSEHTITLGSGRLMGRTTAGSGNVEEIAVSSRFSLSGATLGLSASAETLLAGALQTTGGAMTGDLSMGSKLIHNVANPVATGDAANKAYADLKIACDGTSTVTADIPFGNNKITQVAAPTAATDAANKAYVDTTGVFAYARITGGSTPSVSIGAKNVTSVNRSGAGIFQIVFTTPYGSTKYAPVVTRVYNASDTAFDLISYVSTPLSSDFTVSFIKSSTSALTDSFDFIVVVLGGS